MFRKFWLDTILATAFIFGIGGLITFVSAFKIFDVFDPIGQAFDDMELTDIVFSQLREDPVAEERIVLVNIGQVSRPEIGEMLNIINKYNPRVVGIDTFFDIPKDTLGDFVLEMAFANTENLVMPSKILFSMDGPEYDSMHYSYWQFMQHADDTAYVNLLTEAKVQEDLKMNRQFMPKNVVQGEEHIAFGVKLASYYDPEAAEKFLARDNKFEIVNYRGNVLDYGASKFGNKFFALDVPDVFEENFTPDMIEDKVVIFAYLGRYLGDRESFEDKFYTPLNSKYIGRSFPDMYGGVIHANIVSMILNEDYVDEMGDTTGLILAILLCWLNVSFFSMIYHRIPKWYDGATKLIQLIEIGILIFLMILVFHKFSYKMDLFIAVAVIALAGDALEVYFGVIKNAFTREGRQQLKDINKL